MKFKDTGLSDLLVDSLNSIGFEEATPIQEQAIGPIIAGKDLIGCAQTGTGKTAAFLLPILHDLSEDRREGIQTVILVPTRELATQIDMWLQGLSYFLDISSLAVMGGGDAQGFVREKEAMKQGVDMIIATPGKFLAHLNLGYVDLSKVRHLVMDEADRMMDMGFYDDMKTIISKTPDSRQTLLFSATMAPKIRTVAQKHLKDPFEISLAIAKPAAKVKQSVYLAHDPQKPGLMDVILKPFKNADSHTTIVFCGTKKKVNELSRALDRKGYKVAPVSSDLEQKDRELALRKFQTGEIKVIVATDVLSRGIDIKNINLVVNYDVPRDSADYVHRVGRTARADTDGEAITLVTQDEMRKLLSIEKLIEKELDRRDLPEGFGKGPTYGKTSSSSGGSYKKNYKKPYKPRS
jgi:superfamily II DNA/RNA helicase